MLFMPRALIGSHLNMVYNNINESVLRIIVLMTVLISVWNLRDVKCDGW
jgi:hypothetical protein